MLFDHLGKVLDRSKVYTCPTSVVVLESLSTALHEPATKRRRENSMRAEGDLIDQDDNSKTDVIHFKLVHCSIGKKKTVRVHVGAGGRLRETDILVSLHNKLTGFGDATVVSCRAAALHESAGPSFVLSAFTAANLDILKAGG